MLAKVYLLVIFPDFIDIWNESVLNKLMPVNTLNGDFCNHTKTT